MYDTVGSDWQALGGVQYRRLEIYPQLDWGGSSEDCRLDQHVVAAAPCGGPVAMVRYDAALVKLVGAAHAPPLRIFTSSGKLLAEVPWEGPSAGGRLIAMGWTSGELLVTVRDQGLLQLRDLRGTLLHSLMLLDSPPSVTADGTLVLITHAVVSGDSVAAATSDLQLLAVEHLHQHAARAPLSAPRCRAFTLGRGALQRLRPRPSITAVAVSTSSNNGSSTNNHSSSSSSTALELTVATAGGDTWLVSEEAAARAVLPEELQIGGGSSIVQMAVSPGGVFVACFTAAGLLLVLKDSLSLQVMEFDTSTREPPQQMVWCGNDCVILHWSGLGVLMVGPGATAVAHWYIPANEVSGSTTAYLVCMHMLRSCRDTICAADSLRAIAALVARHNRCTDAAHCMLLALTSNKLFPYPRSNPLVLVQEVDCCRIISQQRMELLQRVPPTTEAINRIGSTDPAAMLFDATEAFEDGDAKADENIRAMARAEAPPTDHTSTSANATDDSTSSSSGEGVLQEAVRSCTAAAAVEFDTLRQKALLRAAAYGKGFLPDYDSDDFVACCRKLRVLNAIRSAEVGVPLTAQQYDTIGAEAVIDMLIRRRLHLLALKACQHLRLPAEGVAI
eukprot:18425-Heterococcus_DN1.PRE.1